MNVSSGLEPGEHRANPACEQDARQNATSEPTLRIRVRRKAHRFASFMSFWKCPFPKSMLYRLHVTCCLERVVLERELCRLAWVRSSMPGYTSDRPSPLIRSTPA